MIRLSGILQRRQTVLRINSEPFLFGAPGMARGARMALLWVPTSTQNDLEVKVLYRPGKGNG